MGPSLGKFTLDPSLLSVGDKIYYRGTSTEPTVTTGQKFTQITGLGYLDFCTWSLEPRSLCDFSPDAGCP